MFSRSGTGHETRRSERQRPCPFLLKMVLHQLSDIFMTERSTRFALLRKFEFHQGDEVKADFNKIQEVSTVHSDYTISLQKLNIDERLKYGYSNY